MRSSPGTGPLPGFGDLLRVLGTFAMVAAGWIFFRSDSIQQAFAYFGRIFSLSTLSLPSLTGEKRELITIGLIFIFTAIEWIGRRGPYGLHFIAEFKFTPLRYLAYYASVISILVFSNSGNNPFIYFQF